MLGTICESQTYGGSGIVEDVEDADTSKHFTDDMRQRVLLRHWRQQTRDIIQLRERIDVDCNVGEIQTLVVPEDHPDTDTEVSQDEVRCVFHGLVVFGFSRLRLHVEFVEPVELDTGLWEEESANEEWLTASVANSSAQDRA